MKACAAAMVLSFLLFTAPGLRAGAPGERILHFDNRVEVQNNGWLVVTETIDVQVQGGAMRHGINRDFPQLDGFLGLLHLTTFTVQSVTRDGQPEPWRVTGLKNGVRVHIGSSGTLAPPGPHTYQLTYATDPPRKSSHRKSPMIWRPPWNNSPPSQRI